MRAPVDIKMFIRTAKADAEYKGQPGIKNRQLLNSRSGGAFGMVRSQGHQGHQGWDIYAPVNTPVVAIADGVIANYVPEAGYGRHVILTFKHPHYPEGLHAMYAHLSQVSVSDGQTVSEGDTLGYTGTSAAPGVPPHLHFEIRTKARPPMNKNDVLKFRVSPGEILGGHYGL